MSKPDPTVTVEINCGCGQTFKGISQATTFLTKGVTVDVMRDAMQHAYDTGHTIDGFIRIQPN